MPKAIKQLDQLFYGFLLLAGCSGPMLGSPSAVFTPSAREVDVYDVFEVEVRAGVPGNPFVDASLRGRFQRAGEPAVDVDGFWDGDAFRIRYMPSKFGEHVYSLTLQANHRTFENKGAFKAREVRRRGPVRVDKVYPWHFVWEGTGERYLWNSTTAYGLLGLDDAKIKEAVDRLATLKVDRLRVGLTWRMKNAAAFGPWAAERPSNVENPGYDVKRFDLLFWRKAERLARYAREKDVAVSWVFYVDGARPGSDPFGTSGWAARTRSGTTATPRRGWGRSRTGCGTWRTSTGCSGTTAGRRRWGRS
jgi:hypothetical protein